MNTTTVPRTCNLHLTKNCATCHKFANECDFGACKRTAGSCAKHIKDMSRNYPATKVEVGA